jgi:hypothetical protein
VWDCGSRIAIHKARNERHLSQKVLHPSREQSRNRGGLIQLKAINYPETATFKTSSRAQVQVNGRRAVDVQIIVWIEQRCYKFEAVTTIAYIISQAGSRFTLATTPLSQLINIWGRN